MSVKYHQPDYILISLFAIIIIFGLVVLSSAGAVLGYQKFDGDSYYYIKHQLLFGILPGLVLLFIMANMNYRIWKKFALVLLVGSIVLLALVFIPGLTPTWAKAKSWIVIGNFSLQPSEIVKLTFLLYLAGWLEKRTTEEIKDFSYGFLPFIILLGIISLLIILQPDIGTMSIIVLIALTVYFVAGARWSHLGLISAGGLGLLFLLIKIAPYRAARLTTFLHPEFDPRGIGYHINQALLAIGSGGLFGVGLGQSRQKFLYLPEVTADSIFAIIAEELGFIIVGGLIVAFLVIMYRGFKIAKSAPDTFGRLVATGIIAWFIWQTLINIGAMVGLLPITGLPLPFISYGGTAMMISLAALGVLINISRQTREV